MKPLKIAALALLMGTAGIAFAQSAPGLTVSVAAPATVSPGANETIATIGLRAGAESVSLDALPISLGYSSPQAERLTDCALRSTATGAALNSGQNALGAQASGDFTVTFDSPVAVPANTTSVLYLTCDVPVTVANGNAIATSIFASQVEAESDGDSVTVAGSDPQKGITDRPVAVTIIASQVPGAAAGGTGGTNGTPGVPNTGGASGVPGIPNTGGGDGMVLWTLLALFAFAATGIGGYALTRRA